MVVEPLVDQWYAWSHLISPATAAMNIEGRHLQIMESYVKTPQMHMAAVKNPAMLGGPFIDYPTQRVDDIRKLIERTKQERAEMLLLAQAIKQLSELLRNEATGFALDALYPQVPDPLKGYVELVYDLNNAPAFRFIKPLLYRSRYYNTASQSLMLSIIDQDHRPFILSTPRLEGEGDVRCAYRSKALPSTLCSG